MNTIYKDCLIEITGEDIVFHHYYFPFGQDKRVAFVPRQRDPDSEIGTVPYIANIEVRQPSFFGGSWRIWGTGGFRTWFPCDFRRPFRDRIFIAHLRNRRLRIGFTVEHSRDVTTIFKEKHLLQEP